MTQTTNANMETDNTPEQVEQTENINLVEHFNSNMEKPIEIIFRKISKYIMDGTFCRDYTAEMDVANAYIYITCSQGVKEFDYVFVNKLLLLLDNYCLGVVIKAKNNKPEIWIDVVRIKYKRIFQNCIVENTKII